MKVLTKQELIELLGNHYAFNLDILGAVITSQNVCRVCKMVEHGLSPYEIATKIL